MGNPNDPKAEDVKPSSTQGVTQTPTMMSINIPRFYAPDPQMFFVNVESQFALASITGEKDMYIQLTARLEPEILAEVSEVIKDVNTQTYTHVKNAILKRFSQSEENRLNKLLGTMELGDKQPSQFLREIQRLGPDVPENIIRGLWLKKLPSFTQQILQAVSVSTSLTQQAEVADKVMSVPTLSPSQTIATAAVSNVHHPVVPPCLPADQTAQLQIASSSSLADQVAQLQTQVTNLSKQFSQLLDDRSRDLNRDRSHDLNRDRSRDLNRDRSCEYSHNRNYSPHNRDYSRDRNRPRDRARSHPLCRIHYKFGAEARHCLSPKTCTFLSNQSKTKDQGND
uniref:DUF7041 domain-containing protein n=1 Tax=Cacopsylla melanoneura TaxID=428564 RepID=A0A8D8S5B1_9HEMI